MPLRHSLSESDRDWVAGIVVSVATVISFVGFAFASLKWTLIVASIALTFLLFFLWSVGFRKQRARGKGDARRKHSSD